MLRGDNGILNRGAEAKFANGISQFDEQTKLAAMSVKTSIESNKVSKAGYIATKTENVETLANEAAKGLGVTAQEVGTSGISISSEGYTVVYYVKTVGDETTNGEAYIGIWYTDNSLRSTMGNVDITRYGLTNTNNISPNEAVLVAYIHIGNYNSEMSEKELTSLSTGITFAGESSSEQSGSTGETGQGKEIDIFWVGNSYENGEWVKTQTFITTITITSEFTKMEFLSTLEGLVAGTPPEGMHKGFCTDGLLQSPYTGLNYSEESELVDFENIPSVLYVGWVND